MFMLSVFFISWLKRARVVLLIALRTRDAIVSRKNQRRYTRSNGRRENLLSGYYGGYWQKERELWVYRAL